jgi:hypothetical protein
VNFNKLEGGYCVRAHPTAARGFQEQKGHLQKGLEAVDKLAIFYPKFH